MKKLHVLGIMFLLLAFSLWATPANLFQNGSFEQDGSDWYLYLKDTSAASATVSYPSTGAQEGTKFCRVTVTKVSSNTANNWYIQLQTPSTWVAKKGVEYYCTFWAKADAPHTFQAAIAGDSVSPYTYRTGIEMSVGTSWRKYQFYRLSDVEGTGAMRINFYCAYAPGVYDFDNVVLTEYTSVLPPTISIPSKSAWESGIHRNIFAEMGHSQAEIDEKVNSAFQQLFFGDHNSEAVYTEVDSDIGFINTPGSGSIITEGQSYGMMISVMMNRQDVFKKLWKFAYTYMMHHSGDQKGTFSWKVNESAPYTMVDPNPAPDGEEYFVTALLFAAKRWGNQTGIFNYQEQADSVLYEMLHKVPNNTVVAEINPDHAMILFTPDARSKAFTDPSYHLPAFYSVWAKFATNDKSYWQRMADSSRVFLKRACHSTTGLMTDYANFDGTPNPVSFNQFSGLYHSDSWRVPANIGVDYAWCKADNWEVEQTVRLMKFFKSEGDYKQTYTIDGIKAKESNGSFYSASAGQIACNAVSALASNDTLAWKYVDAFWKAPIVSGNWRYYSGLLQMLGLLHCSGKFVIYGNPNLVTGVEHKPLEKPVLSSVFIRGNIPVFDIQGRVVAMYDAGSGQSLSIHHMTVMLPAKNLRLPAGIYYVKLGTGNQNMTRKLILTK